MQSKVQFTKKSFGFLSGEPVKIQTTNGQEVYNHMQFFDDSQWLVIDFRSEECYSYYHLRNSINVPLDQLTLEEIVSFDESKFVSKYIHDKHQKMIFKARKRSMIILIPFEEESVNLLLDLPSLLRGGVISEDHRTFTYNDQASLVNTVFFKKMLQDQRHRHTYLCKSGMKQISSAYPSICNFMHLEVTPQQ